MAQETVLVPDIGSDTAEVVEVLVAPGDRVAVEQGLVVLESDKASMEVPSTVAGTVVEILAAVGDEMSEGSAVIRVETDAADASPSPADAGADATPQTGKGAAGEAAREPAGAPGADGASAPDEAPAAGGAPGAELLVCVPDIGTDEAVDLIEIAVSVGDVVAAEDTLIVLESDKASMEVPAPAAGRVAELKVAEGQQLREGDAILVLETEAPAATDPAPAPREASADSVPGSSAPAEMPAPDAPASSAARTQDPQTGSAAEGRAGEVYAGPAVRRLAREFGVSLGEVRGSGPSGRVLKEDLQAYVQRALKEPPGSTPGTGIPAVPEVDFAAFGPVEEIERSRIDTVTAANMQRSWLNVPHVTQFDDADITELEAFRKSLAKEAEQRGTRLTPLPFLLKACAVALRRHEKINASLSDGGRSLTYKRYVHIGMAVDTPAGLLVPVLRDVDRKSLWELAEEVLDLASRARDRKLRPAEMQGAGFTVSSLGAMGGRGFTPIVNTPEVAILGVGKSAMQPVWDGDAFQPRLMLPLSLSYDHRVVNGGDGGRFLTDVVGLLGDIRRLLL